MRNNACFNRFILAKSILIATSSSAFINAYQLIKRLVIVRIIDLYYKYKTHYDVFSLPYGNYSFSEYEMDGKLTFLGAKHEGIVKLLNEVYARNSPWQTDKVYFDATNFYFEIDCNDDLRKKGPSKENHHDPIVCTSRLLDGEEIPLAVSSYPGNQSEKSELPKAIELIKNGITLRGNSTSRQ